MALAVKCWSRSNFTLFIQIPCWASPWRGFLKSAANKRTCSETITAGVSDSTFLGQFFGWCCPSQKTPSGNRNPKILRNKQTIFQRWAGVTSWRRIPSNTMASSWIAITPSLWWKVFWTEISQLSQAQKKSWRFFLGELMYTPVNSHSWLENWTRTEDVFPIQKSGAIPAIAMLGTTWGYLENLWGFALCFLDFGASKEGQNPKR